MTTDGNVLLRLGDLEHFDWPLVRRGYDPVTVQNFIAGMVRADFQTLMSMVESLRRKLHDEETRGAQLNELLHGRDIDPDTIIAEQAEALAAQCLADAQDRCEQYEASVREHCAMQMRDAGWQYNAIISDAMRIAGGIEEDARAKAEAAAATARAASPPAAGEASADLAAANARYETYAAEVSGAVIIRAIAEPLADLGTRLLQVLDTRQPPATPPQEEQ